MTDFGDELAGQNAVREELLSGESIEWTGRPDPSVIFCKSDVLLIPFSILWGGFAIFWELAVCGMLFGIEHGGPLALFAIFGLPFVLIGLYFMFGRFFYKSWKKKRTYYAVTNKRVVIVTYGIRAKDVQANFIRDIPTINKSVGANGVGTLVFGNSNRSYWDYANTRMELMGSRLGPPPPAFYDIHDANTVYELVNRLRNEPEQRQF